MGEGDGIDARDIALYSLINRDKLRLSQIPVKEIMTLKLLLFQREKIINAIKSSTQGKENIGFMPEDVPACWQVGNKNIIEHLKQCFSEIEKKMENVVKAS